MLRMPIGYRRGGVSIVSNVLAIDPGNIKSAYALMDGTDLRVLECDILDNDAMRERLKYIAVSDCHWAIEMIASYGMPVGREVFDTCVWIGRFTETIRIRTGHLPHLIFRKDVKLHLCGNVRAKDPNIRQAILDKYPSTGGGKIPQIGTKSQPGPLYGVSSDIWAAIGVGLTLAESYLPRIVVSD
jgi:hypothetical protein